MFLHLFPEEKKGNTGIQIIGEGIDGIKKERQAVRSKIKVLEDELKVVDAEIASLQEDLDAATARKDKAYESLQELRAVRDAKVSFNVYSKYLMHRLSVLVILLYFGLIGNFFCGFILVCASATCSCFCNDLVLLCAS